MSQINEDCKYIRHGRCSCVDGAGRERERDHAETKILLKYFLHGRVSDRVQEKMYGNNYAIIICIYTALFIPRLWVIQ